MKVCLSHMTALHWLLRHFNPRQRGDRASRATTVPSCAPGIAEAQEIRQVIGASLPAGKDGGEPPIDVVVSRREGRRSSAEVTSHLCSSRLPAGSFVPLHLNEGFRVYAGLSPAGKPVFSTRYPDVVIRHRDDQGNLRLLGIDHDPTLTHGGELRRSLDLERGNQLESCRRLVHFTFTNLQTSDYSAFASSMDQVRRALGKRREPREEQGELARRIDCERRDLWERFVHGWSTML